MVFFQGYRNNQANDSGEHKFVYSEVEVYIISMDSILWPDIINFANATIST